MALSLSSLKSSKRSDPPVMLLYGVDGIGKTSLAAEFPDPLYLPTEGERAPSDVEIATPGTIESFGALLDIIEELLTTEHEFKTVIIDSVDGLEPLIWRATCQRIGVDTIESPGFGRGYVEADTEWNELLGACAALAQSGICVVMIAHPEIARFDSPITDPYSRYGIKVHKRASALLREKSDIVAFCNYRISIKEKEVARQTKVAHAEGGKDRQVHLSEGAGFQAKNRYSMPDAITYRKGKGYEELSKYFPAPTGVIAANDNDAADAAAA
jgi:hypothetical protein